MRRRPWLLSSVAVAAATVACSSVPELNFVDDDGGVVLPDGAVVPRDGGDAGIDPNCKKTGVEICDDGIDNDCNGATDCQDTACGAFSCQDAPPDWTAVEFAAAARPACPASTAANDLRVSAGDGTASCTCSCTPVGGACTSGTYAVTTSGENMCSTAAATRNVAVNTGNTCTALSSDLPVAGFVVRALPVGPTSCNPAASINGPITNGRVCQVGQVGKGCGTNQVCAPKPPAGLSSCITKTGANVCPAGFTKRSTAGTAEDDQRTCTGCACAAPTGCTGGSVTLFESSMCKTNGANSDRADIGTSCAGAAPTSVFVASHFKSTPPTGGCSGTPAAPAVPGGTLTFTDQRTLCCK